MGMKGITRRQFVKGTFAAGAAFTIPFSRMRGANNDIRVAVVGFHGHGKSRINSFRSLPGARVVALCDVDENVLAGAVKKFESRNEKVDAYIDIRKMLDDKDIDVVSTAAFIHWAVSPGRSCEAIISITSTAHRTLTAGRRTTASSSMKAARDSSSKTT